MNAEQLRKYRELAERLSYFGIEGQAQDAITALLAEVERLQQEAIRWCDEAMKSELARQEQTSRAIQATLERDSMRLQLEQLQAQQEAQ